MVSNAKQTQRNEPSEEHMSKLDQFFDVLGNKSPSTISGYTTAIGQFMRYVHNGLTVGEQKKLPRLTRTELTNYVEEYFTVGDTRPFTDLKKFIQDNLTDKPGLSALQTFNQLYNFLSLSDVMFTAKERKLLMNQLPSGKTLTQENDLDADTIRTLLQHSDVKGRALMLCLASGGMRIGELLQVQCSDVDLKSIPAVIQIRAKTKHGETKTKQQRYTFISSEAVNAVKEWIKIRPAHLASSAKKSANLKNAPVDINDGRLFPLSDNTVNQLFKDAVKGVFGEIETDVNTGRSKFHIHQFRKFFSSQLAPIISLEKADFLSGHETPLSKNYRRYTVKQMAEDYLKGEHSLIIDVPTEIRESATTNKKELQTMKDDTLKNHSVLLSLMNENSSLKESLKVQQAQLDKIMSMLLAHETPGTQYVDATLGNIPEE